MQERRVDVVIIGSGSAGLSALSETRRAGNHLSAHRMHAVEGDDPHCQRQVLHEVAGKGKIAGYNAAHIDQPPVRFRRKTPFYVNFCDPNIVAVGARFDQIDLQRSVVGEVSFAVVGRARAMGAGRGILRVYADRASGRLLGSEMIAPRGEHLGHLLAWSIEQGLTVGALLRMPSYHPVIEGALKAALSQLYAMVDAKNTGPVTEVAPLEA